VRSAAKSIQPAACAPHCLSDPAVVADFTGRAKEKAEEQQAYGLFAAGITDEAFLTSRHKRDEVCFCEHCQRRFRDWLRARYKDAVRAECPVGHVLRRLG
jgi:hypothetical protein